MQLHFTTFFFARRLYLAVVLLCFRSPMIKVELISISCYAAIYYCLCYSPFADQTDNRLEIFNEVCLLVANLWQLGFSDIFWETPLRKIDLGWFYTFILFAMVAVNFYLLFKGTVVVPIRDWLRSRAIRK